MLKHTLETATAVANGKCARSIVPCEWYLGEHATLVVVAIALVFIEHKGAVGSRINAYLKIGASLFGRVLNKLSDCGANILTISQNPPIGGRASVVVSMDISSLSIDISDLIAELSAMPGVENPLLIDIA